MISHMIRLKPRNHHYKNEHQVPVLICSTAFPATTTAVFSGFSEAATTGGSIKKKNGDVKTIGDKLKLKLKAAKDQATKKTVDPKPNPKTPLNQNQKKPNHVDRGVFTMIPLKSYIGEPV
ncbi:hypothetical protein Tco_1125771 [Tanacetum coccineum]